MRKWVVVSAIALSACTSQTTIQSGYNGDRDECQTLSELKLPLYIKQNEEMDMKQRNAKLVTLFSDCMFERGWTVATPARTEETDYEADQGVGVGASIRPGRFTETGTDDRVTQDAQRAFEQNNPRAAVGDNVRKTPVENIRR